jgi:hypothetical protein
VLTEFGFNAKSKKAGYLLLNDYFKVCEKWVEEDKIFTYKISSIEGISPDYSKFGLHKTESLWLP